MNTEVDIPINGENNNNTNNYVTNTIYKVKNSILYAINTGEYDSYNRNFFNRS